MGIKDELILSLEKMKQIEEFDEDSMSIVVEAGCTLEYLNNHVSEKGYIVPLDLGSKGSCMIGGMFFIIFIFYSFHI